MRNILLTASALTLAAVPASADFSAQAMTDLNLRAGPGPQYEIIGVIKGEDTAFVEGCLETADWCRVSYDGTEGWAYGAYLTETMDAPEPIVSTEARTSVGTVTYEGGDTAGAAAAGGVAGAIIGGMILGGPLGAAAGAVLGSAAGATAEVSTTTVTYVRENALEPVYLEGEVVTGAALPDVVTLAEIPDDTYAYAYVNGLPVIVDPETRVIVHVVR
ncbi:DUF1236 domain-containing protein [Maritimibacter fusiformis]|uniref:DUF1236 domain-containing protein n=2 Tax=Maritimibacter fusiformis TaxID=2603819 RepID=A0A5D0RKS6_9RHOB|nr:DUF1236 domain-containing protein [Maritimibacter fusiformis]